MIQLIKLNKEHTTQIVEIHKNAFPGFFLTELGPKVLEVFYTSLMRETNTIVWGVAKDNLLIGFFAASKYTNGLYLRIFIKNIYIFFFPLIFSFIRNPNLLLRMVISFRSSNEHNVPKNCTSSLLSICVSPNESGKGIGKMLLDKLENELIICNIVSYYLTTDADNNESTNIFYKKNSFQLYSTYNQGNRRMNLYIKNL